MPDAMPNRLILLTYYYHGRCGAKGRGAHTTYDFPYCWTRNLYLTTNDLLPRPCFNDTGENASQNASLLSEGSIDNCIKHKYLKDKFILNSSFCVEKKEARITNKQENNIGFSGKFLPFSYVFGRDVNKMLRGEVH